MSWRSTVLGDAYPFALTDTAVTRRAAIEAHTYYVALLMLTPSLSTRFGPWPPAVSALTFERVVCAGLARFLGDGTQVVRFGWPYEDGRPDQFAEAIRWAADRMRIRVGAGYRHPRRRDGGVDLIAWKPFPDGRPGFPIALVQCTLEEDVVGKSRDIDLGLWSTWLGFDTPPLAVLAVPAAVGRNEDWNEVAVNCVLLERLRLAWLCAHSGVPPALELTEFVNEAIGDSRERIDDTR